MLGVMPGMTREGGGEMPRELIAREVEDDRETNDGPWIERREYDLNVEWGRVDMPDFLGHQVEVHDAIQVTVKHSTFRPLSDGENRTNEEHFTGRRLLEARELYSTGLTRKQVNKLIKTLRKARDQVFGVDE